MELNFLFGNPVKGKKGGKKMAAKKRAKSSAPKKRKVSARKNPWSIGGKRYYTDDEIDRIKKAHEALKPPAQPKMSSYNKQELSILEEVSKLGYRPKSLSVSQSTADKLIAKLDKDYALADSSQKQKITAAKKKIAASVKASVLPDSIQSILDSKQAKAKEQKLAALSKIGGRSLSAGIKALKKMKPEKAQAFYGDLPATLSESDLISIADELKKSNPGKGKKKMAAKKKKAVKKSTKKKTAGKKKAAPKRKNPADKKKTTRRRRRKLSVGYTKATNNALLKSEKSARKQLSKKGKKKGSVSSKRKIGIQWQRKNPSIQEAALSIGKIALAGAGAGVAVQLANRLAKPMIDKVVPAALANLKVGNAPVGQILLSCLVPGLVAAGLKMLKHPMAQQVSDVIIVTTAANAGQRLAAGFLPAGMAGAEPVLMGVEPELMGSADFGDADFGDADFGEIQMYGDEDEMMGDADFGVEPELMGHAQLGYGEIQMYGEDDFDGEDEEYAGEEDMDGYSAHGLG
jgi:hypothetical protein